MRRKRRREVLSALSVVAGLGLAGCSTDGGSDDDAGGPDVGGSGDDDGGSGGDDGGSGGDDGGSGGDDGGSGGDDGTPTDTPEGSGDDATPNENVTITEPSGRVVPGEVSNDLSGIEVVDHTVAVGEGSFSGPVVLRNVGDETFSMYDYTTKIKLFDDGGSILGGIEGWESESRELAPGEEMAVEFIVSPADDVDFTKVASYELVLTCGTFDTGVYCPEE